MAPTPTTTSADILPRDSGQTLQQDLLERPHRREDRRQLVRSAVTPTPCVP
jgi:hypothetical protein